jgi:hypothetical protein
MARRISDPIVIAGPLVSTAIAGASIALGSSAEMGFIIGLISLVLSAQIDLILRFRQASSFAELLDVSGWLETPMRSIIRSASDIGENRLHLEASKRLERCCLDIEEISRGRIRRAPSDYSLMIDNTKAAIYTMNALTNVATHAYAGNPDWWNSSIGQNYWAANELILHRNPPVVLQRIFIYDNLTTALKHLFDVQTKAGALIFTIESKRVRVDLKVNCVIWDSEAAWEAEMNADGTPIWNVYSVNRQDILRMEDAFSEVRALADRWS